MARKFDRKAAVEMSLNLIIMLIIGIVVLGLVIGFVNSLVNQGRDTYERQIGDNERLKLEEVEQCPDNLCMNPDPSADIVRGERTLVFLKVRAFASSDINCGAGPMLTTATADCPLIYSVVDSAGAAVSTGISISGPGFDAPIGSSDAEMYTLTTDTSLPIGTYYMTISMYDGTADETSKTLTMFVE